MLCFFFCFKYRNKLNDIILTGEKMDSLNNIDHNDETVQIWILKKISIRKSCLIEIVR